MHYPIYAFFGLAPSIIWLLFFLRKDKHPESNSMVLKVFFWGILVTIPAALIELGFSDVMGTLKIPEIISNLAHAFLGIALVEEMAKYLIVKKGILKHPEFDEPVDIILYMIISALGFAALENLLILLPLSYPFQLLETFIVSSFRFVGATFLHALCSAILGYFLAMSFCYKTQKTKLMLKGFLIAVFLHGLYDFSIIEIDQGYKFILPVAILLGSMVFILIGFKKVKKLKSTCQIIQ